MNKYKWYIVIVFLIITISSKVYATNMATEMIKEEQENFGISDFLNETQNYTKDFLNDIKISDLLNSAITGKIDNKLIFSKIIKIFGKEIGKSLKTIVGVLIIVLIHSILKTIADDLETSNISQVIYFTQYILIITLVMSNFADLILSITNTINNLVGFVNTLLPLLISLMIYTGSITTGGLLEPIMLFIIQFISNTIVSVVLPIISLIAVLIVISKISNKVQIGKLAKFMKSSIVWFLGILLTVFVGVVSLEGTLTSSVDGVTAKTAKAAVSSMIPVVRQNIRRFCR